MREVIKKIWAAYRAQQALKAIQKISKKREKLNQKQAKLTKRYETDNAKSQG